MATASYLTISKTSTGEYKEKGSKFLAYAYPVKTVDEVKERLDALKKKYYDARHHCYAYILGAEGKEFRANDDGEPNHSAGDPILGQIRSAALTNTLIVVVRYFGGTKLGVGGLINAYKTAAEYAILNNEIVEIEVKVPLVLLFDYESTNEVMRLVKDFELDIVHQAFEMSCRMEVAVKIPLLVSLKDKIKLLSDTGHKVSLE